MATATDLSYRSLEVLNIIININRAEHMLIVKEQIWSLAHKTFSVKSDFYHENITPVSLSLSITINVTGW